MLGKLLKYDCRCTARTFLPVGVIYIVISAVMRLLMEFEDAISETLFGGLFMALIVISFGMLTYFLPLLTVFGNWGRFQKNFFTDEGYLMLTLPVKPWQHIVSKLISALIWYITSLALVVFATFIVVGNTNLVQSLLDLVEAFGIKIRELIYKYPLQIFMFFVMITTAFVWIMLMGYFSTCVSKMLVKSKKSVAEVLIVVGIIFLNITVFSYLSQWLGTNLGETFMEHSPVSSQITFGFSYFSVIFAIFSVIYFIVTCYVLKNKVNLE